MKQDHLKSIIKEIATHVLKEGKIQDPSKEEMMAYLKQQYGSEQGWEDEAEVAIYWFANFYHGGQWSNLYSALSTSPFNPGPIARGPQKDSMEEMMYRDLVHQFAAGEGLEDDDVQQEAIQKHPMDDYDVQEINNISHKFHQLIDSIKNTGGDKWKHLSFGYIGNIWTDARYQPQDDRSWYIWNSGKKWGGYPTKELPEMWAQWEKNKEKILQQLTYTGLKENMGEGKKFTVRFAVLGRETTEETFDDKETAIRAARDFIKSVVTPGAKRSGEYVEAVKNGYIVRQAAGNTVAAAIIQGAGTMFHENLLEAFMPAPEGIVEYLKPMAGARPFTLNTPHEGPQKFEVCIGKLPNGKKGLAIYAYRGDFAMSFEHFNDIYGDLL